MRTLTTCLRALTAVSAAACSLNACRDFDRPSRSTDAPEPSTSRPDTRRFVNANTTTLHSISLQEDAASAWQVEAIALTRRRLFVADAVRDSILVYDLEHEGAPLPHVERQLSALTIRRPLLSAHSDSTVLIVDRDRQQLRILHENGETVAAWHWQTKGEASAACVAGDSSGFVFTQTPTSYRALELARNGSVVTETIAAEPWPGYYSQHPLTAHVIAGASTRGGACTFAHLFDRGLSFLRPNAPAVAVPWIEHLTAPVAHVESHTAGGTTRTSESVQSAQRGARSIAVTADSVLVLFEGRQQRANSQLDVYDASTRAYRHTLRFASRIETVAASANAVALLTRTRGLAKVWVVRVDAPVTPR